MRGATHHGLHALRADGAGYILQCQTHAGQHIRRGRCFDGMQDLVILQQDGIRIGATHINPDAAPHVGTPSKTERKSRSYPKARGPTKSKPRGERKTLGAGKATTVTRWP